MPKKILIVDDEPDFLELLGLRLGGRYKIVTANNGQAGLEAAIFHKPDLILSDLMMPKMNGYDLVKTLKQHVETANIPFVMLSADADTRSIFRAQEAGVADYLLKPVHLDDLPSILQKYL